MFLILFNGNAGTVYGNVTLAGNLTIPSGRTLTVPADAALIVPVGVTLTNSGTITNNGKIVNCGGTINGTVGNIQPIVHDFNSSSVITAGTHQCIHCTATKPHSWNSDGECTVWRLFKTKMALFARNKKAVSKSCRVR